MGKAPIMFARLYDKWFVPLALALFAIHFITGTICAASPVIRVNDQFNNYIKPGFLLLTSPFPHGWCQGSLLGCALYFGTMLFYSALMAAAALGVMTALHSLRLIAIPRSTV